MRNVELDLKGIKWAEVDWIYLARDRHKREALVNMKMKLFVPQTADRFSTSLEKVKFSRRNPPDGVKASWLIRLQLSHAKMYLVANMPS